MTTCCHPLSHFPTNLIFHLQFSYQNFTWYTFLGQTLFLPHFEDVLHLFNSDSKVEMIQISSNIIYFYVFDSHLFKNAPTYLKYTSLSLTIILNWIHTGWMIGRYELHIKSNKRGRSQFWGLKHCLLYHSWNNHVLRSYGHYYFFLFLLCSWAY